MRQLRHHFGPFFAHFSAPTHPTHALWAVFYLVPRLTSCRLVLAIRCHVQFGIQVQRGNWIITLQLAAITPAGGFWDDTGRLADLDAATITSAAMLRFAVLLPCYASRC